METPVALPAQEDRAWSLLIGVMMWLPAALDTYLERVAGIAHADYQVLRWLSVTEEREIHMTHLAATANVTPSHLSRIVARLETKGWIVRSNDPRDARKVLARLTDAGAHVVSEIEPGYVAQIQNHIFSHLTPAQAHQLEDITEAVLTPLRADCVALLPPRAERPDSTQP